MAQKERIKLEIDVLKALILAFLTAIFGIFGYALINYAKIDILQGIGGFVGLIIIFIVFTSLQRENSVNKEQFKY